MFGHTLDREQDLQDTPREAIKTAQKIGGETCYT